MVSWIYGLWGDWEATIKSKQARQCLIFRPSGGLGSRALLLLARILASMLPISEIYQGKSDAGSQGRGYRFCPAAIRWCCLTNIPHSISTPWWVLLPLLWVSYSVIIWKKGGSGWNLSITPLKLLRFSLSFFSSRVASNCSTEAQDGKWPLRQKQPLIPEQHFPLYEESSHFTSEFLHYRR